MADVAFYILAADQLVQPVDVKLDWALTNLLRKIQADTYEPSAKLRRMKPSFCNFYTLISPVIVHERMNISEIMASLQDTGKYRKVWPNTTVGDIASSFVGNFLYLIIEDASDHPETVGKLKRDHADLYRCLEVEVGTPLQWTMNDVISNGGIFLCNESRPPRIQDLETRLCGIRTFRNLENDPELFLAQRYEPQFASSYLPVSQPDEPAHVKDSREFVVFYNLLRFYHPDAHRYKAATSSSSLKAHALKANFILPPFFAGRSSTDILTYQEKTHWEFPLFVSCLAMSGIPWKYTPASDFSVLFRKLDLPLIIAEVISEKDEQDRYRMLVQAIALARLASYLGLPGSTRHPFVVAIHLTANLVAERYILMKADSETEVYIAQKSFDLTREDDAIEFQREMYNLATELESIVVELDSSKRAELEAIRKGASELLSLHSSGAWDATKKNAATTVLDTGAEGQEHEDDLGIFDNDRIRADLAKIKCQVAYVAFGHPNIAPILHLPDGQLVSCLKFIKDGGKELEILQYLAGLNSDSNHTVRPTHTWSVAGGSIINMPGSGNRLTKLHDKDTYMWPVMKQLFEAVEFMHEHGVAHMDLKPANLLIPSEYGTLTVIDFGVSVRIKTPGQFFQSKGRVGTEGYIAPEVGRTKFSAIRADLWSTGKVVEEFCLLCCPSPSRDWLLALSKELLDDGVNKRPTMSEVLQRMVSYVAGEIPAGGRDSTGAVAPI